jgi:hypothetical protein
MHGSVWIVHRVTSRRQGILSRIEDTGNGMEGVQSRIEDTGQGVEGVQSRIEDAGKG